MKTKTFQLATLLIIILLGIPVLLVAGDKKKNKDKKTGQTIQLFNGKDLKNWVFKLKDPSVDPATVFTVQNGIIHIAGNPFGYMRTKETYSDYKLHVEWRWPSEAYKQRCICSCTATRFNMAADVLNASFRPVMQETLFV